MSYARNLTFNLRLRGLSEPEIAEVIDAMRVHGPRRRGAPGSRPRYGRGVREAVPEEGEADLGDHQHDDRNSSWDGLEWSCPQ